MESFSTLTFAEQLAIIESVDQLDAQGQRQLLKATASLADSEPLARLLATLAMREQVDEPMRAQLATIAANLPDPAVQHLLSATGTDARVDDLLHHLVNDALCTWPLERIAALALCSRWQRRHFPESHRRVEERAREELRHPGADPRWLFFLSGDELLRFSQEPEWRSDVMLALAGVIATLARAPKSISQANAESLLASRVYADPGHFFFELLQNADDAGATHWEAVVGEEQVAIRHDGAPFSLRDLVGVLSIGQTTKTAEQIGFFGVGFKSVYEVCERPRIHSGVFDIEIAHISIPRRLSARSKAAEDAHTRLFLPYAEGTDASRLYTKAKAIPPETLLTLPNLKSMAVASSREEPWEWEEEWDGQIATLRRLGTDEFKRYLCIQEGFSFSGERETGRSGDSPILIAIALDGDGRPHPVDGPSLYSFLPTAEYTGLRFILHARLDVTLDRERLEHDSEWNQQLLRAAGVTLAKGIRTLVESNHSPLDILSAPSELSPVALPLKDALYGELRHFPCLPGADGRRLSPNQARLLSDPLAAALSGVDLGNQQYPLAPLSARERSIAVALGCRDFTPDDLVDFLSRNLKEGDNAPAWLGHDVLDALGRAPLSDEDLASLPILLDGSGQLVPPHRAIRSSALWCRLYTSLRAYVDASTIDALPEPLRARLRLPKHDIDRLVDDLSTPALYTQLIDREEALLEALATLSLDELNRLCGFALLRTTSGPRVSIDDGLQNLHAQLEPLRAVLAERTPIADGSARSSADLIQRWLPELNVERLSQLLPKSSREAQSEWTGTDLQIIRTSLDQQAESLGHALVEKLARLAIFKDCHDVPRPLLGPERALLAADQRLLELLPNWPWLRTRGAFVNTARTAPADVAFVVTSLINAAEGVSSQYPHAESNAGDVLVWVASCAGRLPAHLIEQVTRSTIWLDITGERRGLHQLRRLPASELSTEFFSAAGVRFQAHPATATLAAALRIEDRLPPSSLATAIEVLLEYSDSLTLSPSLLARLLNGALAEVSEAQLRKVTRLPLFRDQHGVRRPLGSWETPQADLCHRAGPMHALLAQGSFPLLHEEEENLFAPFLAAVGPAPATRSALVRSVSSDPDLLQNAASIRDALGDDQTPLDSDARQLLQRLPIFSCSTGELKSCVELWSNHDVLAHLSASDYAALDLDTCMLAPAQLALVTELGLELQTTSSLLTTHVLPVLKADALLSDQTSPWNARDSLARLLALAHQASLETAEFPLGIDTHGRLRSGTLSTAPSSTLRLLRSLTQPSSNLADPQWVSQLSHELQTAALTEIPMQQVAHALRAECPTEAPRDGHPSLPNLSLVYDWLLENKDALKSDPNAIAALRAAAILPSQERTLRAPRDLVLDIGLPDLGLGWGLAADVPEPLVLWLSEVFELDRRQRRNVVDHLLSGVDSAAETDDVLRASELITFLAHTIRADSLSEKELADRVSYSKIRSRLKVPVSGGSWTRARRAILISDEHAIQIDAFCSDPPPRINLGAVDSATRALLLACGAEPEIPDQVLLSCLSGDLRRPGVLPARALSRYIIERTLKDPPLRQALKLDSVAWVPDQEGTLKRPQQLLWPNDLARSLVGSVPERFPADDVIRGLPDQTIQILGFQNAADLNLTDVARLVESREASEALLDWLEDGLKDQRFEPRDVRNTMRDSLLLWDDGNTLRPPRQLALRGASELFGEHRGNFSDGSRFAKLTRALGIPGKPTVSMILEFLEEVSAAPPQPSEELAETLSQCLLRLGQASEDGTQVHLPSDTLIAALSDGRVMLARLSDPNTRIFSPVSLADNLPPTMSESFGELLPSPMSGTGLELLLLSAGTRDLWSDFQVTQIQAGPEASTCLEAASELHSALRSVLGDRVGGRVCVVDPLRAVGTLEVGEPLSGYRENVESELQVEVDALLFDETLWLTPQAVSEPARIAAALERQPIRRAAMIRWLEAGDWARQPKRLATASEPPENAPSDDGTPLVERIRGFFNRPSAREASSPRAENQPRPPNSHSDFDKHLFRPESEVRPQLGSDGGFSARRMRQPDFGFAFTPNRVAPPWLYAPKLISVDFRARGQVWRAANLSRPPSTTSAGMLVFRGKLPRGEAILPVPMFGTVQNLSIDGERVVPAMDPSGSYRIYLHEPGDVRFRVSLGRVPDLERAIPASTSNATKSFVPDAELPEIVLEFVESFENDTPAIERALAIRDFIRKHYRYDPSYLEDAGVARWLSRITKGRANAHIAALHAGRDAKHLGAGVCYELNVLACELMRRAGVPAAIATGWVLDGGSLSEADHLWCVALLEDARGASLWVPIDASSTRDGRPLRVPKRPPVRVRVPKDRRAKAPNPVRWDIGSGRSRGRGQVGSSARSRKSRTRVPRAELLRVIRHLEKTTGRTLEANEKSRVQRALDDPQEAAALLARLLN